MSEAEGNCGNASKRGSNNKEYLKRNRGLVGECRVLTKLKAGNLGIEGEKRRRGEGRIREIKRMEDDEFLELE